MKTVQITKQTSKYERGGGYLVNYDAVLIDDELDTRKAVSGSFGVSQEDAIPSQIVVSLQNRLGFKSFSVKHLPQRQKLALPR